MDMKRKRVHFSQTRRMRGGQSSPSQSALPMDSVRSVTHYSWIYKGADGTEISTTAGFEPPTSRCQLRGRAYAIARADLAYYSTSETVDVHLADLKTTYLR